MSDSKIRNKLSAVSLVRNWSQMLVVLLALTGTEGASAKDLQGAAFIEQWGIQEITLHSEVVHQNPFKDVRLEAVFQRDGTTVRGDGFFDGNQTWKIRLMH